MARATTSRPTPASPTDAPAPTRPGPTAGSTGARCSGPWRTPTGTGRAVRPLRVVGPAGGGPYLGRRPGLGLLVAAHAGGRHPDRGRQRVLELVARRGRLPGAAAGGALPQGAAAALGGVRLLHPADAGARALRAGGLDLRRRDARGVPRTGAAARAARALHPRPRRPPPPAADCRSSGPWRSPTRTTRAASRWPTPTASAPRCGWRRCSRRAPASARCRSRAATGSTSGPASATRAAAARCWPPAPLDRPPVFVRAGSLVVTYPAEPRGGGLGDTPEAARPLEATMWGEPPLRPGRRAPGRRHPHPLDGGRVVGGRRARGRVRPSARVHEQGRPAEVSRGQTGTRVRVVVLAAAAPARPPTAASRRSGRPPRS